jgi:hypothetical protein
MIPDNRPTIGAEAAQASSTDTDAGGIMENRAGQRIVATLEAKGISAMVPTEDWESLDGGDARLLSNESASAPLCLSLTGEEVETVTAAVAKR